MQTHFLAARYPMPTKTGAASFIPDWSMSRSNEALPLTRKMFDNAGPWVSVRDEKIASDPDKKYVLRGRPGLWLRKESKRGDTRETLFQTRQVRWAGMTLPKNASRATIAAVIRDWLSKFIVKGSQPASDQGWYSAYSSCPAFNRAKEHENERFLRGGDIRRKLSQHEQVEHYQAVQNASFTIQKFWGAYAATPEDQEPRRSFQSGTRDYYAKLFVQRFKEDICRDVDKVYIKAGVFGIDSKGFVPLFVLPKLFRTILCDWVVGHRSAGGHESAEHLGPEDWFDRVDPRRCGFMELLATEASKSGHTFSTPWWQQLHTWQVRFDMNKSGSSQDSRIDAFCDSLLEIAGGRNLCMVEPYIIYHDFRENYHTGSYRSPGNEANPMDERDLILVAPGTQAGDVFLTWSMKADIDEMMGRSPTDRRPSMVFGPSNVDDGYLLRGDAWMLPCHLPGEGESRDLLINA